MINGLNIFVITFIISFLGSIHPGPLNLSVVQLTLKANSQKALWMALGGVIPEIIYGLLAVEGISVFQQYPQIFAFMKWGIIPVLLFSGYWTLRPFSQDKPTEHAIIQTNISTKNTFFKGFFLSIFNPQLLPFWLIVLVNYHNYQSLQIDNSLDKLVFLLGASLGAFLLNYLYIQIAEKKRSLLFEYIQQKHFDKIIGYTFILMAVFQMIKIVL